MSKMKNKFRYLCLFLAGIVVQLGAVGIAYGCFQVTVFFEDLAMSILLPMISYLVVLVILAVALMRILHYRNWFLIGITSGTVQVIGYIFCVTTLFMLSPFTSPFTFPLLIGLFICLSGSVFVLTYFLNSLLNGKIDNILRFILVYIIVFCLHFGGLWLGLLPIKHYDDVKKQEGVTKQRVADSAEMDARLKTINFPIYLPEQFPRRYKLYEIIPMSQVSIRDDKAPISLSFTGSGEVGGGYLEINELQVSNGFNPPQDCGPYNADLLDVGPLGVPIPCREITHVDEIKVYTPIDTYTAFTYEYYFRIGQTEFAIVSGDVPLTESEIVAFIHGLRSVSVADLPRNLLKLNY
jgi:hypothetical protein